MERHKNKKRMENKKNNIWWEFYALLLDNFFKKLISDWSFVDGQIISRKKYRNRDEENTVSDEKIIKNRMKNLIFKS